MYKSNFIQQLLFILFALGIIVPQKSIASQNYYVAIDGNDSNVGSLLKPFRSIKKGASTLHSGDTLIVNSGLYREDNIQLNSSGEIDNPITIKSKKDANVSLYGMRVKTSGSGGGVGFFIDKPYVLIDGFHFEDYETAIDVENTKFITIQKSTFKNNGESGVTFVDSNDSKVLHCRFIGELLNEKPISVIQDYAIAIYFSKDIHIENNYIYGAHNQSISFKEGCHNSVVKRNIIEGALYTGIYLGQNRREDNRERSSDLVATYNIIRGAKGYRVKSPIRIDNVKNATVDHNYIEGFDKSNNSGGINIFSEVLGTIKIHDNIVSFAINNNNSVGVYKEILDDNSTIVEIKNNTFYNVSKEFSGKFVSNTSCLKDNIAQVYSKDRENLELEFEGGKPLQLMLSSSPMHYTFQDYYQKLINQFHLKKKSEFSRKGYRFISD